MAQVKISELPSASSLTGSEVLPVVQGGSTLGATVNQIKDKIQASALNVLKMNASSVQTLANIGELAFNPDTQTLEVKCSADVTLSIGQENYIRGKNAESSTILNGTVVYVSGGLVANSLIKRAGNADGTAERVIGVATQDIGANNIGFVTTSGVVNKLNTSAYAEGDLLWLGTNGAMTNVKPDTSVDQICIGVVLRSHATEGSILVAVKDDWRDKLAEVRSDLSEIQTYFSDNIFSIKNKARDKTTGSIIDSNGSNTTPLIAINLIYNVTSNGIKIKTGTFRGSSLGVAFFFDVNGNYLGYDSSTITYSSLVPYPFANIPVNAYYISFFQYENNESVILSDYGIHRLDDNSDLIKTNANNISTLITDVDAIEKNIDGIISSVPKTFPYDNYYNYAFANVKAGKYIVKFSGEVIVNGNVDIRKNISGVVSNIIANYNPYLNGNVEIELNEDALSLNVFIPANLALSTTGTMIVALCQPNILDDIVKLQEVTENHESEITNIQNKVNSLSISNIIQGDFSGITPFNFRSGLTYTISGNEVIVTNVATTGSTIWYTKSNAINGHKYYCSINMKSDTNKDFMNILIDGTFSTRKYHSGNGQYEFLSAVITMDNSAGGTNISLIALSCDSAGARTDTRIKFATFCDLTATFGAGKEPSIEWMDSLLKTMNNNNYLNGDYIIQSISSSDLFFNKLDINNINIDLGESDNITQVVNASMDKKHFIAAFNASMSDYATLCKCYSESFIKIEDQSPLTSWEQIYNIVNHNLRKEIFKRGKSFEQCCKEINQALKTPIYRFCDAKIGSSRNFSLNTGFQADEPSAIVSDDGSTLHIYAHLKRISTTDGVNWSEPIDTPLSGSVTYVMHNNVNYIDGVYYLIGCQLSIGGGLYLYTSEDGVNFTQRGKLFDSGKEFAPGYAVLSWGNSYLVKNYGENKWYLYVETQSDGTFWVIHLATCTDLFSPNPDGTIGNWEVSNNNPILKSPFTNIGAAYEGAVSSAGNPDFIKGCDNRPIKVGNKYYMLYHSTWKSIMHIMYASSEDLINWTTEGIVFDNRDQPTLGDLTSGNADQCIVEFKGRTYLFYTWDINDNSVSPYIKYTIDDRPLCELFKLKQ